MKNCFVFFYVFSLCFGVIQESSAQEIIIAARHELSISVGPNFPTGPKYVSGDPTLLANMPTGVSIDLHHYTRIQKRIHAGVWISNAVFQGWKAEQDKKYAGSNMNLFSGGASIMYKTASSGYTRKKLDFCAALSPGISQVKIRTSAESEINSGSYPELLNVNSLRFCIGIQGGLHYLFNDSFGGMVLAGYQYTVADSKIFADKSFSYLNLRVALFYRFAKDKKYKYSGL